MSDELVEKVARAMARLNENEDVWDCYIPEAEAAIRIVREAVIEECARVAESSLLPFSLGGDHILDRATADTIAENIRALSKKT